MTVTDQGRILLSPTLQTLLERIDTLLDIKTIHREYLEIRLPKGVLFLPHVSNEIKQKRMILRMGVVGACLEANMSIQDMSDSSQLTVETLLFDREAGESSYAINNVALSPKDVHLLVTYLVSEFRPYSLNITESE